MPFYDSSHREQCLLETIDAIAMLEGILSEHPQHKIVIGGDLNCELRGDSPFDTYWQAFMRKYDLISCDSLFTNNNNGEGIFTYHHVALGHKKWSDHFIVSSSLAPLTKEHKTLDDGENLSDHLPITMSLTVDCSEQYANQQNKTDSRPPSLKWDKCSPDLKLQYSQRLAQSLSESQSLLTKCHVIHCSNVNCKCSIQLEYNNLVTQLVTADKVLPRHKPGIQKSWWSEELSALKALCVDAHRLWVNEGKPRSGPSNHERLRVRALYRHAIRKFQRNPKQSSWDRLHENLASKDTDQFWKEWRKTYRKDKSHLHPVVNGLSSHEDISESFKSHFTAISQPNNRERVDQLNTEFTTKYSHVNATHRQSCECDKHDISLETIIDATFSMKKGKSFDDEGVSAEHFFHAPLDLFVRLEKLFAAMMRHSYVPNQFKRGTIIPIVKDHHGDLGDRNNYRGITIASIMSKIFEHALRIVFGTYLSTSPNQFGFKKESSTSHALFCLKQSINYYTERGSDVYSSFLDASKAFDRLVHAGLFLKLMQQNIPLLFLDVIVYWYSDLQCRVRWGESFSSWFVLIAGVRQGGILSPDFYCLYVDDLALILKKRCIGCFVRGTFLSILLYADDIALLSPTLRGLQILLDICGDYCTTWDICLNPKKTRNVAFGKNLSNLCPLLLNGRPLEWVPEWKYLGVVIRSHTSFDCSIDGRLRSFYKCLNAILRIEGRSNELVMLQLLESHCSPILSYAIEVLHVADTDIRRKLRVAYNSIFRKIFHYRYSESVRELQGQLQRPTWEELVERRQFKFHQKLPAHALIATLI